MWLWIALSTFFSLCCGGFLGFTWLVFRQMEETDQGLFAACTLCFGVCLAFLLLCLSNVFVIEVQFLHRGEVLFSLVPG